jgi:hypothetical protein
MKSLKGNGGGKIAATSSAQQPLDTRALLGAELPERGVAALARDPVEHERAERRADDGGQDVERHQRIAVVRERDEHYVRPARQRDEGRVEEGDT